jgi:hypothetical protein
MRTGSSSGNSRWSLPRLPTAGVKVEGCPETSVQDVAGNDRVCMYVGCSQNSLTTGFPALQDDLPQVKRGTSHSRSEGISEDPGPNRQLTHQSNGSALPRGRTGRSRFQVPVDPVPPEFAKPSVHPTEGLQGLDPAQGERPRVGHDHVDPAEALDRPGDGRLQVGGGGDVSRPSPGRSPRSYATRSSRSRWTSSNATLAPSATSWRAVSDPMPPAPPVMRTVLSRRS